MFYFDPTYIYLVMPALIFAMYASAKVKSTFAKYSRISTTSGLTGASAARRVLDANGLYHIKIEHISGNLTDHYSPKENIIRLSDSVYNSSSTAAIGVACHEVGHALQYANGYAPIKLRAALIPVTNFGSRLAVPLVILGILLCQISETYIVVAYIGIVAFGAATLFQLLTLPVEFNASSRAMKTLESNGMLVGSELKGARKVLSAAAMTYVAALAVSLAQLLRLISIVNRNRD